MIAQHGRNGGGGVTVHLYILYCTGLPATEGAYNNTCYCPGNPALDASLLNFTGILRTVQSRTIFLAPGEPLLSQTKPGG